MVGIVGFEGGLVHIFYHLYHSNKCFTSYKAFLIFISWDSHLFIPHHNTH